MTDRRPRRRRSIPRGPEPFQVEITCAEDGLTHRVDETAYAAGVGDQQGRYRAVCGRIVLAASMVVAAGRRCPACVTE